MKKIGNEVSMSDLLNAHERVVKENINCHAIGKVKSFDPSNQTCTIEIVYKRNVIRNGVFGLESYPILLDCPVIVLTGGVSGLTMPIAVDDNALVLFNDRSIDNWFEGANTGGVNNPRLHSTSDALVLVGARPLNASIQGYDSENPCLYNGDTKIKVKSSKILLENQTDKLGLLLKELVDTIKAISTTNAVVGVPCTISPASQAQLDAVATKIEGLLE